MSSAPRFGDIRRGDAGRDGGGIFRNIARETRIPNILTKGDYSTLDWPEICRTFWAKASEERIQVNMVDTIILNKGEVAIYLYTNIDGYVSRKPADNLQPNGHKYVAIAHYAGKSAIPIETDAFNAICLGSTPLDLEILQVFIPSKGDPSSFITFKTDYWLDRNARPILKTIRVGMRPEVAGSRNRDSTASMNRHSNEFMETCCRRVVNRLQETLQCKIVRMSLDFVEDSRGKIWLMRSTECLYAIEKVSIKRSISPENRKIARSLRNTHGVSGHSDEVNDVGVDIFADTMRNNSSSSAVRPSHTICRHTEDRISRRHQKSEFLLHTDDAVVNRILSGTELARPGSSRGSARLSPVRKVRLQDRGGLAEVLGGQPPPNASLALVPNPNPHAGIPTAPVLDTAVFGTSQLDGCPGDFCNFDLKFIENKDVSAHPGGSDPSARSDLSDFRRRLLANTSAGVEDDGDDTSSLATTGAFSLGAAQSTLKNTSKKKGSFKVIPFRIIVQTRQEMPLVNRLLRRLRRGDDGRSASLSAQQRQQMEMYVTEDNYGDLAISGKLPSHYYKDVACCDTCFKVYKVVTDARAAAIKVIEKKRDKAKARKSHAKDYQQSSFDLNSHSDSQMSNSIESSDSQKRQSLYAALQAIESLTKLDVAEIRTMAKPPAAVEVVMEAVMIMLTGKTMSFQECRRLLGGGEAFLLMLREFQLENVTEDRLRLIEPYVDNPVFRPENVLPISFCASKFCAWVLGVVQAARWQRGIGHKRSDLLAVCEQPSQSPGTRRYDAPSRNEDLTFVEKLERKKARRKQQPNRTSSPPHGSMRKGKKAVDISTREEGSGTASTMFAEFNKKQNPSHNYISRSLESHPKTKLNDRSKTVASTSKPQKTKDTIRREQVALVASQKRSIDRLASHNKGEGNMAAAGIAKDFRCFDGITKMSYIVLGNVSLDISRCNFIIVHDFFDTCDATAIAFKPIVQRHDGCQVFCFNYPGQANTVWPRPSAAERQRGASEQILNNDWIADRIHELLQHAEEEGDILLTNPFHIVGIGNGSAIAAAFALKYCSDSLYSTSFKSLVSINGFLYPDPQLSAILHSAAQVFESTPHSRPDIPVSYWSRFVFSEDYLSHINPNLALNIYTAVSNPITNDGRTKIARGCLKHKDLRGMLSPDGIQPSLRNGDDSDSDSDDMQLKAIKVPVIILQSTENMLVNASNVDSFLNGRHVKHLWSHQQNVVTADALVTANDFNAQWVGKLSNGVEDYAKFSLLGRNGLKMLLESLNNPRGAFVMWTRAGHAVFQENKTAVLDLMDALANPIEEYCGISYNKRKEKPQFDGVIEVEAPSVPTTVGNGTASDKSDVMSGDDEDGMVLFEIAPPQPSTRDSSTEDDLAERPPTELEQDTPVMSELDPPTPSRTPPTNMSESGKSISFIDDPDGESKDIQAQSENVTKHEDESVGDMKEEICGDSTLEDKDVEKNIANDTAEGNSIQSTEHVGDTITEEPVPVPSSESTAPFSMRPENIRAEPLVMSPISSTPQLPPTDSHVGELQVHPAKERQPVEVAPCGESTPSALKEKLDKKVSETLQHNAAISTKKSEAEEQRIARIASDQAVRREKYQAEDDALLSKLDEELEERRKERERAERLRRLELQQIEQQLIERGIVDPYVPGEGETVPIKELPDMKYDMPADLPSTFTKGKDAVSCLDNMLADEADARRKGIMSMDQYEQVKSQMVIAQINRDQKTRHMEAEEQARFLDDCARLIQRVVRGHVGRLKAARAARDRTLKKTINRGVKVFQAVVRGCLGRKKAALVKRMYLANLLRGDSIVTIQRTIRGYLARKRYRKLRRFVAARDIQRVFRGHIGRLSANRERKRLEILRRKERAAAKIQSVWRMKVAKEEFRSMRIHVLAAIEIQRWYRGYLGRKITARRREWEAATPGPERIKLGLRMIEESKIAFERQQEEIDALHRAQERAEARVSHIHAELKESEKELVILERELQEIDQIERDLQTMTHERDLLATEIKDAAGMPRTAHAGNESAVLGQEPGLNDESGDSVRRKKAEAYALELTIQIKRAEREKKRQELETEFASVFQEVEKKRKALERLESALADMESTRERKDREFKRLQKNLMQLLLEQKQELDDLREKGIELETATATTAAAATATAQKAKEHEKRSTAMFSQTEELMKFQFMSMSLSYFSSLNMLKQLRDMNSDTTSAAVASSADAAAAAAAAATAANLPSMKKLDIGADDFVSLNIQKKKAELAAAEKAEREVKHAKSAPLPSNIAMWSVDDVCKWMETLSLGQYCAAFREATVDGPFLMELREEDLVQVLGVEHKLHVRKIIVSREKLKPLTQQEVAQKVQVEHEELAEKRRGMVGVPDLDTVFSQARNGRLKRLEESLNLGFPIDTEDSKGNTLLLVAAQNSNRRMVEMLCARGASINHQNAHGNTALHFAMSFDKEGLIAEYLIQNGADDTVENVDGLTPYDGVK